MSSKSDLTCSYCSKIYKDPVWLPCQDNICREHLLERDVITQNKITCSECKKEFAIENNQFESNKIIQRQLENKVYLNNEEIFLKQQIEESIRVFYEIYENFTFNKNKLDSDCHNHFQEIRFQLDEHRENLKIKIDDIYMEMIEKTKKIEASYLKKLNENLESSLEPIEFKSEEKDLEELELKFRDPNLLIESIRVTLKEKEKEIATLQSNLIEMSVATDDLKNLNQFKPNLTFDKDLFGFILLNEYSTDQFKSQILKGSQSLELIKLCQFSLNDKFKLLYRASRDGFAGKDFHSKCDDHANTLTIIKASESGYIFGGFSSATWVDSFEYKSDSNAFLFSLTNNENRPCKMRIKANEHQYAIYCGARYGPSFGAGNDIFIASNSNTNMYSCSNLGSSYNHSQYRYGTKVAKTFLAGSYNFKVKEIEVYKKQ